MYNTAALTELPIGNSKADFIMINGRGVVYEIKTDLDNLIRLEDQLKDYYKVFSYIYVVVGNKQLPHVKEFLKDQKVGIYELTASGRLICRKKLFIIEIICHMKQCSKCYVKRNLNLLY